MEDKVKQLLNLSDAQLLLLQRSKNSEAKLHILASYESLPCHDKVLVFPWWFTEMTFLESLLDVEGEDAIRYVIDYFIDQVG
jgi:hypothetical protein